MKVLYHVEHWPPGYNAGAETMGQAMLEGLGLRGVDCRVLEEPRIPSPGETREVRGVQVHRFSEPRYLAELYRWADIVLTHLNISRRATALARDFGKPIVHVVHNTRTLRAWEFRAEEIDLLVFNSRWVALDQWNHYSVPGIVVYPPVYCNQYSDGRTQRLSPEDRHIGFINLTEGKGAGLFWSLARALPNRKFLACRGAYGEQIIQNLPNVTVLENTADVVQQMYSRCDIMLVPSRSETWGRVPIEAGCSGIPSIAHPTAGLLESMGSGALFRDRDRLGEWIEAIWALDQDDLYGAYSAYAALRSRSLEQDSEFQLDCLQRALEATASRDPRRGVGFAWSESEALSLRAAYGLIPPENQGPVVCANTLALEGCMSWGLPALPVSQPGDTDPSSRNRIAELGGPIGKFALLRTRWGEIQSRKFGIRAHLDISALTQPKIYTAEAWESVEYWFQENTSALRAALENSAEDFQAQVDPPVRVQALRTYQGQEGFVRENRKFWVSAKRSAVMVEAGLATALEVREMPQLLRSPESLECPTLPGFAEPGNNKQLFRRYLVRGVY